MTNSVLKAVAKPANAFHVACDKKGLSKQIISSYGWRLTAAKCEDQFTAFLNVNTSDKAQFLRISGFEGFFIDSLAKRGPKS